MRAAMGRDAVAAALAVGYRGAGTVEFIVDAELHHYFLEMNTRLQVEHPVTECITGLDLVEWQLRVAAGEPLPLTQEQITFSGHAIEARLYAEDPYDGWKPQTGRIVDWRPERVAGTAQALAACASTTASQAGGEVTPYYDAMVAKFIAHGRDRADAVRRLTRALEDVPLFGLRNNGRFLRDLVQHPQFTRGRADDDAARRMGRRRRAAAAAPGAARRRLAHRRGLAGRRRRCDGVRPGQRAPASTSRSSATASERTLRAPPDGRDRAVARRRRTALRRRRRAPAPALRARRRHAAPGDRRRRLRLHRALALPCRRQPAPTRAAPAPRWPASWRRCWWRWATRSPPASRWSAWRR